MDIEVLYFEGCPNWEVAKELVDAVAAEFAATVTTRLVATPEDAERLEFRGSPTVLVNGVDPFASAKDPVGLMCRIYVTPAGLQGSPSPEMLQAAVEEAASRRRS